VLQANGITSNPAELLNWIAARRAFLAGILPGTGLDFALSTPSQILTNGNVALLSGTASPAVRVYINGSDQHVTWITPSNWVAQVFAPSGNAFAVSVSAVAPNGATTSQLVNIQSTAQVAPIESSVLINEIMFAPSAPGAGFIELFNNSASAFDLSSFRINELNFVFPLGTWIAPGGYLMVVENRSAFTSVYGAASAIAGELRRPVADATRTLTVVGASSRTVIDKVKYDTVPPWPGSLPGSSLQLRDSRQDNARVGNWAVGSGSPSQARFTPGTTNSVAAELPSFPSLYLNELQPVNLNGITNEFGEHQPWIELINSSTNAVSLDSFYLTDSYTSLKKWPFPPGKLIGPGEYLLIWADGRPDQTQGANLHASFRLDAGGGSLALVEDDPLRAPLILDYIDYPALPSGRSYGSIPNGQLFSRETLLSSTPRAPNPPPPIFINEWMASNTRTIIDPSDNNAEDWFELYNASPEPRDLGDYALSDSSGSVFVIPQGTIIGGRGFLLFWADGDVADNGNSRSNLHVSFGLKARGDQIRLTAPDGVTIDFVSFGRQIADISEGRWPDGITNNVRTMPMPTPGAPNRVTNNSPPVISALADYVLTAGQTLSFQATASDTDSPWQTFAFSLPPGAPSGVFLASDGLFSWTPTLAQAPSTNRISLQVTDQGYPPLSATSSFSAIVVPPPSIGALGRAADGQLALTFNSLPGKTYNLFYKNSLADPNWLPSEVNVRASNASSVMPITVSTNTQRFFKISISD